MIPPGKARWATAVVGVGVLLLAWLYWARKQTPPEELVRQRVVQMTRAVEKRDLGFLMDQISPRFHSSEGLTRDELKGYLAAQVLRGTWLRVFTTRLEVHATGPEQVDVSGTFLFGRSQATSLKDLARDSSVEAQAVDATFEHEPDGEWRVVTAAHRSLSQEELLRQGP